MVYTSEEYCKKFKFGGRLVCSRTIERRCQAGMLPSGHRARKLSGPKGAWVIEVDESVINENLARNFNVQIKVK